MARRTPEQNRAIYQRRKARLAEQGTTLFRQRQTIVETPAGAVARSFDYRAVTAFLRRAGDQPVQVIVDVRNGPQLTIFAHYGWRADAMLADIRAETDPPKVKRAVLGWIDQDKAVTGAGPTGKSRGVTRRRSSLGAGQTGDADALLQLGDLRSAQFVTVPRRRAVA